MGTITLFIQVVSGLAFLGYGIACLGFGTMEAEFKRYGLEPFRFGVGLLEIAGGLGLLAGLYFPPLTVAAGGGLALLMAMGVVVRWRLRDTWAQMAPAAILGGMNGFLVLRQFY